MSEEIRNKQVLMVTTVFPRWKGDATPPFVLSQARHLLNQGWEVTILAPHSPGAAIEEEWEGIRVVRFRYLFPERWQSLCYEGGILTQLARAPWKRWQLPFLCLAELWEVWRYSCRLNFDLVHAHSIIPQGLVACLRFLCRGRPVLVSSHGADVFSLSASGFLGALKRVVLKSANLVTANSTVGKQALLELEVPESKIRVLPSTPTITVTDAAEVDQVRQRFAPRGERIVLFVGRLIEQKGVDDLLHAFAQLPSQDEVRLVIVGDGTARASLEAHAKSLKIHARVTFTGWLSSDQITPYFEAADVFVAPSKPAADGAVEAQGLVFVEAMAAGAALIGTRCGGIVDMVKHGETGLLVEPGDSQALSTAIQKLLYDPELRAALVQRARELYEAKFSPEVVTQQLIHIYEETIRESGLSN